MAIWQDFFQVTTHRSVIFPEKMEYDTYLSNITVIPLIILLSLGVKLKTVFNPNLNNLNSYLKAIIDSKNGKLKIQWISIQHSMHKQFVALYDYSQHNFRPKMLFSWIPAPRTKQTGYNFSCSIHCNLTSFNRTSNNPKWYND